MSDWPTVIVGVAGLGTTLGAVYLGSLLERAHRNEDLRRQELAERNRKLRSDASDLMSLTNRLVYHIPHKVPSGDWLDFSLNATALRARTRNTVLTPLVDEEIAIAGLAFGNRSGTALEGGEWVPRPISTVLAISLVERTAKNHERLVLAMDDVGWPW
ncbi:MAG: hypothetical protein AMXMBFR80_04460 [Dehalococcoidia bacterium]